MIDIVDDPWPQNIKETIVYSIEKSSQPCIRSYYVRIKDVTFRFDKEDLINLNNNINGILQ